MKQNYLLQGGGHNSSLSARLILMMLVFCLPAASFAQVAITNDASDKTVACDGAGNQDDLNTWLTNQGGATATSTLGEISWTNDFTALSDDCGATGSAYVTFTASDGTSSATTSATFTIQDSQPPQLKPGAVIPQGQTGMTLCAPPAGPTEAEVAGLFYDACGGGITVTKTGRLPASSCEWKVTYSYTVTDECNNSASFDVTYEGTDMTPPLLVGTLPGNQQNLQGCMKDIPPGPSETDIASLYEDNCGGPVNVSKSGTPAGTDCNWWVDYTYVVSDACGNTLPAVVITYSGGDKVAPELLAGATIPLGAADINACFNAIPAGPTEADIAALYTDNCGGPVNVSKSGTPTGTDCNWSVAYTYVVSDACGNTLPEVVITYSGGDKEAPVLKSGASIPSGATDVNACFNAIPAGPTEADIAALYTDNCGGPINVSKSGTPIGTDCNWSVAYTYVVSDACGNTLPNVVITYSGGDKEGPVLKSGASIPLGAIEVNACFNSIPAGPSEADIAALYTDNCGGSINVTKSGTPTGNNCGWEVIYTYIVSDACGNDLQPFTITYSGSDQQAPLLAGTLPAGQTNMNICIDEAPAGPTALEIKALYNDDCSEVTVTKAETTSIDGCAWTITYTYEIKDACGNLAENAVIVYSGASQPVAVTGPQDTSLLSCDFGDQAALDAEFATWIGQFVVTQPGCNPTLPDLSAYAAPALCMGGTTEVTFTHSDHCSTASITRIFTVTPPEEIVITGPANTSFSSCDFADQQTVNAAFNNWIAEFTTLEGGCNTTPPDLTTYSAPDRCQGGTTTVIYSLGDICTEQTLTRTFTINPAPEVAVYVPASVTESGCNIDQQSLNASFAAWKQKFEVTQEGCGVTVPDLSGYNPPSVCGGSVTIEYTITDGCTTASASSTYYVKECYTTIADGDWKDPNTWKNGCVPSHNGGLETEIKIIINHDVTLDDSFLSTAPFLDLYIGGTLTITGNVTADGSLKTYILDTGHFQIGTEPIECEEYDFCTGTSANDCDYQPSTFYVKGSAKSGLYISGSFHLYGDFVIENKFDIEVESDGEFVIEGTFTAKNTAEVGFYGEGENTSSGTIGCNMNFENGGTVHMIGATLDIGGDMLFGNASDIYIYGSTLSVIGEICSFEGIGSGAIITAHHGYFIHPKFYPAPDGDEAQINAGYFCNNFNNKHDIPLPIELLSFTAEATGHTVMLQWSTATEINNDYFTIERSSDLTQWEAIGQVHGAGNSNQVLHYSFNDRSPLPGISYYQLKQTDFDGRFETFGPLSVVVEANSELNFSVSKQPGEWIIQLQDNAECRVEVYTLSGRQLLSQEASGMLSIPPPGQTVVIRVINQKNQAVSRIIM